MELMNGAVHPGQPVCRGGACFLPGPTPFCHACCVCQPGHAKHLCAETGPKIPGRGNQSKLHEV